MLDELHISRLGSPSLNILLFGNIKQSDETNKQFLPFSMDKFKNQSDCKYSNGRSKIEKPPWCRG